MKHLTAAVLLLVALSANGIVVLSDRRPSAGDETFFSRRLRKENSTSSIDVIPPPSALSRRLSGNRRGNNNGGHHIVVDTTTKVGNSGVVSTTTVKTGERAANDEGNKGRLGCNRNRGCGVVPARQRHQQQQEAIKQLVSATKSMQSELKQQQNAMNTAIKYSSFTSPSVTNNYSYHNSNVQQGQTIPNRPHTPYQIAPQRRPSPYATPTYFAYSTSPGLTLASSVAAYVGSVPQSSYNSIPPSHIPNRYTNDRIDYYTGPVTPIIAQTPGACHRAGNSPGGSYNCQGYLSYPHTVARSTTRVQHY